MKKLIITSIIAVSAAITFGNPHRPVNNHPIPHPPMHHHGHNRHGGVSFWTGLVTGTVIGSVLTPKQVTVVQPVQTVQPVVVQQKVWIPGHYEDIVQPNGTVLRVWIPGQYVFR